jgi:UDP-N-acetylglucosamine diphosphorylase/glucosamine-1-phosphate N-acetyltransferase
MNILLDDVPYNESLFPFGALKSMVHIRIGILSILEKWQRIFQGEIFLTSQIPEGKSASNPFVKIPANIIPSANYFKDLDKGNIKLPATTDCKVLKYPWQIFEYNKWAIEQDFELITSGKESQDVSSFNQLINAENIFVEEGAMVSHSILNATEGPIYIGKNAEIQEGCILRGPLAICEKSRLKMGTKIYGATTIGPYCLAGGEIKNSILMNYSNKAHDGYLGDSVIGSWCNLGAGTSNSNLKNTAATVKMWSRAENEFIDVGTKCGLLMGDYSRSAINTSFNTGTMVGISCNIFGTHIPPKFVDNFTWGNEKYILERAITDIDNWKKLKGLSITEEEIDSLKKIF